MRMRENRPQIDIAGRDPGALIVAARKAIQKLDPPASLVAWWRPAANSWSEIRRELVCLGIDDPDGTQVLFGGITRNIAATWLALNLEFVETRGSDVRPARQVPASTAIWLTCATPEEVNAEWRLHPRYEEEVRQIEERLRWERETPPPPPPRPDPPEKQHAVGCPDTTLPALVCACTMTP